ncbi:MAG: lysylphosphatidylglycerol synthase transmembrane domain-containing protein [Aquabacterium sp.]|nr:lysylphosphatidylglycerol synthase transmembrane domain-containing protein [Aquabacterium sp.]
MHSDTTATTINPEASLSVPIWRRMLVYGVFGIFALWCLLAFRRDIAQIDLAPLRAGWLAVLAAGGLSLLNYALRVLRWRWYLVRLGHVLPWRFVALTFMAGFAFTLSPGKLGEMVRARYYQPHGIAVSAVTGAFFVERLLDLVVMILLAVAVLADLQAYRSFLWVAMALVGGLVAAIALVPWTRVAQWLDAQSLGRLTLVAKAVVRMFVSARLFLSPGILLGGLLIGLLAWSAEAYGLKLVADVIAPVQLSVPAAMGIYAIAIIVGALSFLPGGLGSTEAVMAALLVAHGFHMPQAILLTLICRLLTLWLAVVIGWACVWSLRRSS